MIQKLPKGWKIKELNRVIVDIIDYRGKTPRKLGGNWSESGTIALSAMNVKQGQLVNLEKARFVNDELYNKWMKSEVTKGDILMTSEAPLGETYLIPDDRKICLSQRLFCIRANPKVVLPRFLFYFFNSPISRKHIDLRATGTTVLGIRQSDLREIPIVVPPSRNPTQNRRHPLRLRRPYRKQHPTASKSLKTWHKPSTKNGSSTSDSPDMRTCRW